MGMSFFSKQNKNETKINSGRNMAPSSGEINQHFLASEIVDAAINKEQGHIVTQ
jgi:hypothetical protein